MMSATAILSVGGARCSCRVEGNVLAQGRAHWRQGRAVEAVRCSGKFGARLTRPGNAGFTGFTGFIGLRNGSGVIARGWTGTSGESG